MGEGSALFIIMINEQTMKQRIILFAAVALMAAAGMSAQTPRRYYGGPGIVMAGSQNYDALPEAAKTFIKKHFGDAKVTKCEQYFAKHKYEVELSGGVDIDFDDNGKVIEIDAPGNQYLPAAVVRDILHDKAYRRLEKDGLSASVEAIEFDKRGRAVEVDVAIPDPDTYVFDIDGNFIAISD